LPRSAAEAVSASERRRKERDDGRDSADDERNAPAPALEFRIRQKLLQDHHDQHREQLSADQRHILKRREKAAVPVQRHFAHVGRARAVFAAD